MPFYSAIDIGWSFDVAESKIFVFLTQLIKTHGVVATTESKVPGVVDTAELELLAVVDTVVKFP